MSDQKYVSAINITDVRRKAIPTGQSFIKSDLVDHTFRTLVAQGYIVPEGQTVEAVTPGGLQVTGPGNTTPMSAIYPPDGDSEALKVLEEEKRQSLMERLRGLDVKVHHNTGSKKMEKMLSEALARISDLEAAATAPTAAAKPVVPVAKPAAKPKDNVAKVWDFDPAELEKLPQEQLVAKYLEQCKKFNKTIEKHEKNEDLIVAMSIEFGK